MSEANKNVPVTLSENPLDQIRDCLKEDKALDLTMNSRPLSEIYKALGYKTVKSFYKYLERHPDFEKAYERARELSCQLLEDRVLGLVDEYEDTKKADLVFRQIQWLASVRCPAKYSQKMDISLNQTISIKLNLDSANTRIDSLLKDVTPKTG